MTWTELYDGQISGATIAVALAAQASKISGATVAINYSNGQKVAIVGDVV